MLAALTATGLLAACSGGGDSTTASAPSTTAPSTVALIGDSPYGGSPTD